MRKTLSVLVVVAIVIGFPAIGMIAGGRVPAVVFFIAIAPTFCFRIVFLLENGPFSVKASELPAVTI